jgi:predicted nucleic acid-binding Zn ribbon protein
VLRHYILGMPTYVYETISPTPERFEVRQGFNDPALATHPETGEPVRRVISGGLAVLPSATASSEASGPGCGPATCQCGRFS